MTSSADTRLMSAAAELVHDYCGSGPEAIERSHKGNAAAVFHARAAGRSLVLKIYEDPHRADGFEVVAPTMERARRVGVPVPRVLCHGRTPPSYAYLMYEHVPGVPADEYRGDPRSFWEQVGRYVARVNSLRAPGYGRTLRGASTSPPYSSTWSDFIEPEVLRLTGATGATAPAGLDNTLRRRMRTRLMALCSWQFDPAVIHGSITGSNIIVAPETAEVRCIIDWDEMLFARAPHFEQATALLWMDREAQKSFLHGYDIPPDAYTAVEEDVKTARRFYLARYHHWHYVTGNEALLEEIRGEMHRILDGA